MARANQPDRNLRNEVQSQIEDLAEESGTGALYDDGIYGEGTDQIGQQAGTASQTGTPATAMRTKATAKTAAQQSTSMQNKKGNQPPGR